MSNYIILRFRSSFTYNLEILSLKLNTDVLSVDFVVLQLLNSVQVRFYIEWKGKGGMD